MFFCFVFLVITEVLIAFEPDSYHNINQGNVE